jgi:hypothetical protein
VLLYELLTGTTPVYNEQLQKAAFDEIRRIIREEDPPKSSTRISTAEAAPSIAAHRQTEPARLIKLVRGELDWIAMKSLTGEKSSRASCRLVWPGLSALTAAASPLPSRQASIQ